MLHLIILHQNASRGGGNDSPKVASSLHQVGVEGIGPTTSRSQSERSTDELVPERLFFTARNPIKINIAKNLIAVDKTPTQC